MQLLSCKLGEDLYALPIQQVIEVLAFKAPTPVPRTPAFLRGVINLRGRVLPVIDLKLKLGMGRTESSVDTCIVILESMVDGDEATLGVLADAVLEVLELQDSEVDPSPRLGNIRSDLVRGVARYQEGFIILLDVERAFANVDLGALATTAEVDAVAQE